MTTRAAQHARSPLAVAVQSALRRGVPTARRIANWARTATGARGRGAEVVVRIVGLVEGRKLNAAWRGKDYATNVLSFPPVTSGARHVARVWPRPLGDIVICAPVVAREAREQGKPLEAHWAHLVVHGALHLLGYDHERNRDAVRMESRERRLLAQLGWADPYASPAAAAAVARAAAPTRRRRRT